MSYYPEEGAPPPSSAPPSNAQSRQNQAGNQQYKAKRKTCNPCCCIPLRIGCIVIGVLQCLAIFSAIWMVSLGASDTSKGAFIGSFNDLVSKPKLGDKVPSETEAKMAKACGESFAIVLALGYAFIAAGGAVLLVAAIMQKLPILCLIHIGLTCGGCFLFLLEMIICATLTIMVIIIVILVLPWMALEAYFMVCSWFYRKQLIEEMMDQKRSQAPMMYSQSQQEQQQKNQPPYDQSMMMPDSGQMDQPPSGKSSGHKKHKGKNSVMPATEDEDEQMMEKDHKGHQSTKKRKSHSQAHRKQSHHDKEMQDKDTTDDEGKVHGRPSHPKHKKKKSLRRKSRRSLDT